MALDVEERFKQHVAGRGALFRRINRPYCIMAARKFSTRQAAGREERALKRASQTWVRVWCRSNQYHGHSAMDVQECRIGIDMGQ